MMIWWSDYTQVNKYIYMAMKFEKEYHKIVIDTYIYLPDDLISLLDSPISVDSVDINLNDGW